MQLCRRWFLNATSATNDDLVKPEIDYRLFIAVQDTNHDYLAR